VFAQLRKARQTWKDEESGVCAIAQGNACPYCLARVGPLYFSGTIYMRLPPHILFVQHSSHGNETQAHHYIGSAAETDQASKQ
jgi:hypothetical protein